VWFREQIIQIGYFHRDISWAIYLIFIIILFIFHKWFIAHHKKVNIHYLLIGMSAILLFSFPFLSHDLFNYMFDARILTHYGKNPYFFKALDFPADKWTRFMHWTHRVYPYGPVFLLLSLIPSILGWGKFTLTLFLFKAIFIGLYVLSVILLAKLNKKWAITFATHPLILVEGLISSHNDLVALSFAVIGIYFLYKNKNKWGRVFFLLSFGIKYVSLPVFFLRAPMPKGIGAFFKKIKDYIFNHSSKKSILERLQQNQNVFLFIMQILVIYYVIYTGEIQPWYFLALLAFIPFLNDFINKLWIFFFGLLLSYYPYIRLGVWDMVKGVNVKHAIIYVFLVINIIYLFIIYMKVIQKKLSSIKINIRKK